MKQFLTFVQKGFFPLIGAWPQTLVLFLMIARILAGSLFTCFVVAFITLNQYISLPDKTGVGLLPRDPVEHAGGRNCRWT